MQKTTLYLMVGYPGAGKTTAARIIEDLTGATHIWADHERNRLFRMPTHELHESEELYRRLNAETERLLAEGKSVVFDTSFNYAKDRNHMKVITDRYGAELIIVWVQAPKELAKSRALHHDHARTNKYPEAMTHERFERIVEHLEEPKDYEHPIVLDGTSITPEYISQKLGINLQ